MTRKITVQKWRVIVGGVVYREGYVDERSARMALAIIGEPFDKRAEPYLTKEHKGWKA